VKRAYEKSKAGLTLEDRPAAAAKKKRSSSAVNSGAGTASSPANLSN
jgi:hypothetical protein